MVSVLLLTLMVLLTQQEAHGLSQQDFIQIIDDIDKA
jgi:hypothetical protein